MRRRGVDTSGRGRGCGERGAGRRVRCEKPQLGEGRGRARVPAGRVLYLAVDRLDLDVHLGRRGHGCRPTDERGLVCWAGSARARCHLHGSSLSNVYKSDSPARSAVQGCQELQLDNLIKIRLVLVAGLRTSGMSSRVGAGGSGVRACSRGRMTQQRPTSDVSSTS